MVEFLLRQYYFVINIGKLIIVWLTVLLHMHVVGVYDALQS